MVTRWWHKTRNINTRSIKNKLFRIFESIEIIIRSNNLSSCKIQNFIWFKQPDEELQATFKVVKNPKTNVSDAVIKTRVIAAINEFFALDNWDFGDSFYFTELAAYIHQQLSTRLINSCHCA